MRGSPSWHHRDVPGRLTLCATPIGNLADASPRLSATLAEADVIFAEDTRRTATLLAHVGATTPMRSFFAGNERSRLDELADLLAAGEHVVLVSDAGMPSVSDPGASAVRVAVAAGATVSAVPGPSAVTSALAVSGFGADRFVFAGFLPRKGADRPRAMEAIRDEERTVVFFAAPSRLHHDLSALRDAGAGERQVVIARELTKLHEEVWRGSVGAAADEFSDAARRRGEFTVVVEGATPEPPSLDDAVADARRRIGEGATTSDAARDAARERGVSRREVYERILRDGDD